MNVLVAAVAAVAVAAVARIPRVGFRNQGSYLHPTDPETLIYG